MMRIVRAMIRKCPVVCMLLWIIVGTAGAYLCSYGLLSCFQCGACAATKASVSIGAIGGIAAFIGSACYLLRSL